MASIDTLKSTISKKGGLAKGNRFNVIFTPPTQSLLNLNPETLVGSLLSGTFSVQNLISDPRDISLLCQSAQLPGRQISTIDYQAHKQAVPIPYTVINEDVQLKFLLTNDYYMKILFDNWESAIIDVPNYKIGYKKDFSTDVVIQQLNEKNVPVYGVKLENAFPTTVTAIELDNSAENTVQELSVTLSYDNFVPEGPVSSTGSALRQASRLLGI
jgi:hypothetical protein